MKSPQGAVDVPAIREGKDGEVLRCGKYEDVVGVGAVIVEEEGLAVEG